VRRSGAPPSARAFNVDCARSLKASCVMTTEIAGRSLDIKEQFASMPVCIRATAATAPQFRHVRFATVNH